MLSFFEYEFMQRAVLAGLMIAVLAPMIGVFLVAKRYSLLADTLSHVSLVGVAFSLLSNIHPLFGALLTSILVGVGIEELRLRKKLSGESVLALVLSGSLALAIVLFSLARSVNVSLISILFGSITTVTSSDLWTMLVLGSIVLVVLILGFKRFFLVAYDEELAQANGLPVRWLNLILVCLAAITVSLSIRMVGTLLVGALMVIPVLTAHQLKLGFLKTALWSVVCSLLSVMLGLGLSFYLNLPSGGAIVLVALSLFLLSLLPKAKTRFVSVRFH
ncbi:metal ABC transporter permease [Patescibacteria group bacterium]|nr:metal ABC transporter permease [Patescibacteria group bacterium]